MSDLPQIRPRAAGLQLFAATNRPGPRSRRSTKTWSWKSPPRMPPAAMREIDTVPDSRGATINVHYSISKIPQHRLSAAIGRRPRGLLPHGGEGFFAARATATSSSATSTAGTCKRPTRRPILSPPKKPIMFYLEKTVPFKYRKAIRDGIYEWNKAFEKAGFSNAIDRPAAGRQRRHGPGGHPLQHLPLDHEQRRLCDGPEPRESVHGPDSRRRHHLRRRLPDVLEAGVRDVHRAPARSPR